MSSRRRRSKGTQADAFENKSDNSLEQLGEVMYGGGKLAEDLRRIDAKTIRIKNLPLSNIQPDPAQARRVMPARLRARWLHEPLAIGDILDEWLFLANDEALSLGRAEIDIMYELQTDPENDQPLPFDGEADEHAMGPIETSFRAMLQLAASIHHHGLTNPITVASTPDNSYLVETGERRLLAYNLLHSKPKLVEGDWDRIPARVVESRSAWRQAAENSARQDLNAISMARQLALLLMDIYGERYDFADYSDMPGVEWYAQVHDSKQFPVPYGRGSELAAAMGLKSANQLRQYRQLLGLPNEVWELADENDWTEYKIRKMMQRAREAASTFPANGDTTVTTVTDSDGDSASPDLDDESVTTVTVSENFLVTLAQFEAGQLSALPSELDPDANPLAPPTEKSAGKNHRNEPKPRRRLVVDSRPATVVEIDPQDGSLHLKLDSAELLEAIIAGDSVTVTIHRLPEK
jgi:hypothetical protein